MTPDDPRSLAAARFSLAKRAFTEAAQGAISGDADAADRCAAALTELEAAQAELRALSAQTLDTAT